MGNGDCGVSGVQRVSEWVRDPVLAKGRRGDPHWLLCFPAPTAALFQILTPASKTGLCEDGAFKYKNFHAC